MHKTCTKCRRLCSHEAFHRDRTRKDGLFSHCKACVKQYRQSERGKQLHRSSNLSFQSTEKGKACLKRAQKRYQQSPKGSEMYRQAARRRLARQHQVECLSDVEVAIVKRRFGDKCFNCGQSESLEIDHHYPISMGYGLTLNNAVLLCRTCNASKSDRLPDKFYFPEKLMILKTVLN